MNQKMGLKSVTSMQVVSVTPPSSFVLDCAMHTTWHVIIECLSLLQSIPPTTANKQTRAQNKPDKYDHPRWCLL